MNRQERIAKLKATDQPSSGNNSSARPPKTAKPPKKKQGT